MRNYFGTTLAQQSTEAKGKQPQDKKEDVS